MWRSCFAKTTLKHHAIHHSHFIPKRELHSRYKKAMEYVAKGWNVLKEVNRVLPHARVNDSRLLPDLRKAKTFFELALEVDSTNTQARYYLAKVHLDYFLPGTSNIYGTSLLHEAADMGDADAQYELAGYLRKKKEHIPPDDQAFYYLEKAAQQLHPGALFLLGTAYLTGDCVEKNVASAIWCFHKASQKKHAGAAIAYGALLLQGVEVPERIAKWNSKRGSSARTIKKDAKTFALDPIKTAREQFVIAAEAGCDLGFVWLKRLDDEVQRLQTTQPISLEEPAAEAA